MSLVALRLCGSNGIRYALPDENPTLKGNDECDHDGGCGLLSGVGRISLSAFESYRTDWHLEIFAGPTMDPRIAHVSSFIRSNYHRRLTLTEMADTVNLSRWRLCHLFKESMGTSPERYLTRVRLEKARQLLETEFLTVKEVMNRVGMSDASYFARSFKSAYGVTPGKIQRRI